MGLSLPICTTGHLCLFHGLAEWKRDNLVSVQTTGARYIGILMLRVPYESRVCLCVQCGVLQESKGGALSVMGPLC